MKKQNKKDSKNKESIQSLNDELYNDFSLEELEQRLETAAWLVCGVDGVSCPNLYCGSNSATETIEAGS